MSKHVHICDVTYIPLVIYLPCIALQRETLGHAEAPGQFDLHRQRWHSYGRPILCTCTTHFIKLYYYMSLLYTRLLIIHNWTMMIIPVSYIWRLEEGIPNVFVTLPVSEWRVSYIWRLGIRNVSHFNRTIRCPIQWTGESVNLSQQPAYAQLELYF